MRPRVHRLRPLAVLAVLWCVACADESADGPGVPDDDVAAVGSEPRDEGSIDDEPGADVESRLADALRPAMDLVGSGRFEEAFALADAYAAEPDALAYQAEFMRGYARHKAKRYAAAREHFEGAVQLAPSYHPTWHFLGFACHALGELDRAEQAFREHERLQPGEGDDAFGLGIVALDRDDLDEAEAQLRRALGLHAQDAARGKERRRELAKVYARLGDVHAQRGEWEPARTMLVQAVQQFSGHDEIWHKLALAHQRLGEDDKAAEALAVRDEVRAMAEAAR